MRQTKNDRTFYQMFIIEVRKRKELTQKDVADAIGVSLSMYKDFERGARQLSLANTIKLDKFFKLIM